MRQPIRPNNGYLNYRTQTANSMKRSLKLSGRKTKLMESMRIRENISTFSASFKHPIDHQINNYNEYTSISKEEMNTKLHTIYY